MAASTDNTQLYTWNITEKQRVFPLSALKKLPSNSEVSVPFSPHFKVKFGTDTLLFQVCHLPGTPKSQTKHTHTCTFTDITLQSHVQQYYSMKKITKQVYSVYMSGTSLY